MRRLVSSLSLLALAGCINWEHADLGYCNNARLERRFEVCDPDRTFQGPPAEVLRLEALPGDQPPLQLVATTAGAWALRRGAEAFELQRLGSDGAAEGAPVRFGTSGSWWAPLLAADGAELVAVTSFSGQARLASGGTVAASGGALLLTRLGPDGTVIAERVIEAGPDMWVGTGGLAARAGAVALTLGFYGELTLDGVTIPSNYEAILLVLDASFDYRWHAVSAGCAEFGLSAGSVALDAVGAAAFSISLNRSGSCELAGSPITFAGSEPLPSGLQPLGVFIARVPPPETGAGRATWVQGQVETSWPALAPLGEDRLLALHRANDSRLMELSIQDGSVLHTTTFGFRQSGLSVGPAGEALVFANFSGGQLRAGPLNLGPFDDAPNAVVYQPLPQGGAAWAQAIVADEDLRQSPWALPSHGVQIQGASLGGGRVYLTGKHWGNLWLGFTQQLVSNARASAPEPWLAVLRLQD